MWNELASSGTKWNVRFCGTMIWNYKKSGENFLFVGNEITAILMKPAKLDGINGNGIHCGIYSEWME